MIKSINLCMICGSVFKYKKDLMRHFKSHWKNYTCNVPNCYKSYARIDSLKRHKKSHEEKFFCLRCKIFFVDFSKHYRKCEGMS